MKRSIPIICLLGALWLPCSASPELGLKTVVLDAGHGGKDPGCVSADGRSYEKRFVLDIATRLKTLITESYPDVNVLMTRPDDTFVPLINRARFATRNDASLFISIHVNAQKRGTNANGYSIHLLGQSEDLNKDTYAFNMDVCQRENSVIYLEKDYNTTYKGFSDNDPLSAIFLNLMHTAYREQSLLFADKVNEKVGLSGVFRRSNGVMQNNFAVLRLATMPAVLLELGFITNPEDLTALRDSLKIGALSRALFEAFSAYKGIYDASVTVAPAPQETGSPAPAASQSTADSVATTPASAAPTPVATPAPAESEADPSPAILYGTQIFASGSLLPDGDPRFMGYTPTVVKGEPLNKYIIGTSASVDQARQLFEKIRGRYPDSFMVFVEKGEVKRLR